MAKLKIRFRTCKVKSCGKKYEVNPYRPLFPCCSNDCGYEYQKLLKDNLKAKKEREDRKDTKVLKEGLLTHKDWIQVLQKVFNTFIRLRDKDLPCISCKTTSKSIEYAAGHYIPTTYQFLRFNELNVHKQCNKFCNMMKSGNIHEYRINLIIKIGFEEVEKLEADRHKELQLSIPEIKELITKYKNKIKELK